MSTQDNANANGNDNGNDNEALAFDVPVEEAAAAPVTAEPSDDLADRLRRTVAEVDNVRKRCARQVADERVAERARVAAEWLPVLDNLERALEHAGGGADPVLDGVRAVRDQAVAVLARLGYPRHAETGVPFDPYRHEAVGVVEDAGTAPGQVAQVVRPGYGDGPALLRPAAVLVAGDRG
jgi:molecular chaperone GrpE